MASSTRQPHSRQPLSRQLRAAARFTTALYADRAGLVVHGARGDAFSQLRGRPGRVDPYRVYDEIRSQGGWVTTRLGNLATVDHAECSAVLRSRRFGVQPEGQQPGPDDDFDLSFLDRNPPDHTRLRRLASTAFSPRRVAGYRQSVEKTVDRLLDAVVAAGEVDLVSAYAAPLPIAVITELLGIPDADSAAFTRYGTAIGGALGGIRSLTHARELSRAGAELDALFDGLFEQRRVEPRDDLISDLVAVEGDRIHSEELRPMCGLLLIAGFETTVNLIGNAVHTLLDRREQWELLVADPDRAGAVTQEVLRFEPPVHRTARISFDDTEVHGRAVRRGQFVHVLLGGANRDPEVFARPAVFDPDRADVADHLSFSSGIHHCLGRPLAELEATVALARLAERAPG
ncbi:MAG: cytochrome P450, partial [Nocardioides sp.]